MANICLKYLGFIGKILSLKLWIPLSKMTYCAYLINPLITITIAMISETTTHLDIIPSVSIGYINRL